MFDLHREAEQRASRIRADLELGNQAIPDILSVLEHPRLGLTVFVQPWPGGPEGAYIPRGARKYVFLNGARPFIPRLRFTGAHELGHHVFGDEAKLDLTADLGGTTKIEEVRANSFAACFLLPRAAIAVVLGAERKPTADHAMTLASEFGVSYQMATYRLHNTGFINAARRDELLEGRPATIGKEFRHQVSTIKHLPASYLDNASAAYRTSRLTFDALADLLRIDDPVERRLLAEQFRHDDELHDDDEAEINPPN
jgi:Zn-dependent peptidase ImmA (M78 family)